MKKLSQLSILLIIVVSSACTRNGLRVDSACHREIEDEVFIPNYDSFVCVEKQFSAIDTVYRFDAVIDEIGSQMKLRGYENSKDKPSLIVFYALFPSEVNLSILQRSFRGLGKENMSEELKKVRLRRGTLMLQFVENDTHRPIWMGYAAGLVQQPTNLIDEKVLRKATREIFDNYRIFAKNYLAPVPIRK